MSCVVKTIRRSCQPRSCVRTGVHLSRSASSLIALLSSCDAVPSDVGMVHSSSSQLPCRAKFQRISTEVAVKVKLWGAHARKSAPRFRCSTRQRGPPPILPPCSRQPAWRPPPPCRFGRATELFFVSSEETRPEVPRLKWAASGTTSPPGNGSAFGRSDESCSANAFGRKAAAQA